MFSYKSIKKHRFINLRKTIPNILRKKIRLPPSAMLRSLPRTSATMTRSSALPPSSRCRAEARAPPWIGARIQQLNVQPDSCNVTDLGRSKQPSSWGTNGSDMAEFVGGWVNLWVRWVNMGEFLVQEEITINTFKSCVLVL